ncbi:hypothetical protein BS47DRAFT_1357800 [Hydnum rufescens UP504]|uniref:Uncharacterized protein n=1 Tax=Hydnum rufescens UP504 TaxID=1448309 RepID=A0A9P6B9S1_9AGAM|nr:hypothetical protein BS47DRAFT_1357800 [Hydnum rufescens UP504]
MMQKEQRSEPRPAKQNTRPSDDQPPCTEPSTRPGCKGSTTHPLRRGCGTSSGITTNTNEDPWCDPHPRTITRPRMTTRQTKTREDAKTGTNHTPAIAGVWFYTRFSPEPPPNETPPPLEMTTHPPTESPKRDPPNETQKRGRTTQGPGTPDEPHTRFSGFSPEPTTRTNPKSKTRDPAEDSRENGRPRTPKMTPSRYKTVPHTHFGGIQTPEMTTYPNGEVPSCTPDHTRPSGCDGTTPHKNKTELPN